jgi:isoleucyl-tRNA synthetase
MREFAVSSLPRNNHYELDPHRPYIDEVVLISPKSGKEMRRIKEVADVWLDSGAMPFAQDADTRRENTFDGISYPADFISEAIDQTRGWFYTLLAEGVLRDEVHHKNVICLGALIRMVRKCRNHLEILSNHGDRWTSMEWMRYVCGCIQLANLEIPKTMMRRQ